MGIFVKVEVDKSKCSGCEECGKCVRVCPVSIFAPQEDLPSVIEDNEDECTLCEMCLHECIPGAIVIRKLYE